MKKIAFASVVALAALSVNAAEVKPIENVYDLSTLTKQQIYTGARTWFAENFVSAQDVIQMDDKEAGTIVGNGMVDYKCKGFGDCLLYPSAFIKFTIRIDTKDAKMRTSYSNVDIYDPKTGTAPLTAKQVANIENQLVELSNQLANKVKTNQTVSSNW